MKHYINPNTGALFAFESDGSQDTLIAGYLREATPEEIRAVQAPTRTIVQQQDSIKAQITQLEQEQLLPRITREFMLAQFAAVAQAQGIDPMTSIAYVKLKAFDDQVAALRDQLV